MIVCRRRTEPEVTRRTLVVDNAIAIIIDTVTDLSGIGVLFSIKIVTVASFLSIACGRTTSGDGFASVTRTLRFDPECDALGRRSIGWDSSRTSKRDS